MKTTRLVLVAVLLLGACNRERLEQLEKQNQQLQSERDLLKSSVHEREQRIVETFNTMNEIYEDIARVDEELVALKPKESAGEAQMSAVTEATKQHIANIKQSLEEKRKKIEELTKKNERAGVKIASLNSKIKNLTATLEAKQQQIVELESQILGLNTLVAAQGTTIETQKQEIVVRETKIREHEGSIARMKDDLERAFYVVASEDKLEQDGVIQQEGGFLFGWGSVPVLAHPIDDNKFVTASIHTTEIGVPGTVTALVPPRGATTYRLEEAGGNSRIVILEPDAFWQEKHLAVVTP
jgi:predicted  nucleic acid-binding Zn-ribbon protein